MGRNSVAGGSRHGLTLVELLCVIGIIVLLVAILLPVLFNSRSSASCTACSSNLKQLGYAFAMYAQDYDDYWPSPGGLMGNYAYWSQSDFGGLECYVKQRGVGSVWCCPLLKKWSGRYAPRSYSMNSYLRDPADIEYPTSTWLLKGINVETIEEPADTVLLFEGYNLAGGYEDRVDYIYRCGNWTCVSGYAEGVLYTINSNKPWHNSVNNYLYCDGHVKPQRPGRKTVGLRSTWKEMYQWYASKEHFYRIYGEKPAGGN